MSDPQQGDPQRAGYPEQAGFVAGSATSREAAQSLDPATLSAKRAMVYSCVVRSRQGRTCDEVEVALGMLHQTASARLRELELGNLLDRTTERRRTRAGRNAFVYRKRPKF